MNGRTVVAAIERGATNPEIRALAAKLYGDAALAAFGNDHARSPGKIRASDAGRCVREVWAELHDKLDLPEDVVTQLSRFDIGTAYGAWLGALLKATIETENPDMRVRLEVTVERHGVTGHIDALIEIQIAGGGWAKLLVVEFKSTYGMKNKDLPSEKKPHQCIQATHYALGTETPAACVVTFAPSAYPADDRLVYEDLDPSEWDMRGEIEYDRLHRALLTEEPDGDPDAPWRCQGCRYGACEKNKNPMARTLALDEV